MTRESWDVREWYDVYRLFRDDNRLFRESWDVTGMVRKEKRRTLHIYNDIVGGYIVLQCVRVVCPCHAVASTCVHVCRLFGFKTRIPSI